MKFINTSLPSRTIPYSFDEIVMEPFGVPQIMLLSKAIALSSLKPAVEAINDVINIDVNILTDGDFFYLLSVQRLKFYHSPVFAEWTCDGQLFSEQEGQERIFTVKELQDLVDTFEKSKELASSDEELDETIEDPSKINVKTIGCNEHNIHNLVVDDLNITYLDNEELPEGLDWPRVGTLADSIVQAEDPDLKYLAQAMRWLKTEDNSFAAKKAMMDSQQDLQLIEKAMHCNNTIVHGVNKEVVCTCKVCGKESSHIFEIRPETFFDV